MSLRQIDTIVDTGRALIALAWTTVLFRVGGRRAVAGATRRAAAAGERGAADAATPAALWRAQRAVRRASRLWPAEVMCLQTALALHYVLRARGVSSLVRLGVRHEAGRLAAHAWVEAGAQVLDDARLASAYAVLASAARERTAA